MRTLTFCSVRHLCTPFLLFALGCGGEDSPTQLPDAADFGTGVDVGFEAPVDRCEGVDCSGHGACSEFAGAAVCACDEGYSGADCDACADGFERDPASAECVELAACAEERCSGRGECSAGAEELECTCETGYAGSRCSTCAEDYRPDEDGTCLLAQTCGVDTCSGNGTCDDSGIVAECTCDDGFGGDDCSGCAPGFHDDGGDCVEDATCIETSCDGHGTCDDEGGTISCVCDAGYAGDHCDGCAVGYHEDDSACVVDEACAEASCSGNGTCDDTTGVVSCDCETGYDGASCAACADGYHDTVAEGLDCVVDEVCGVDSCSGNGACDDDSGVVVCACDAGYALPFCASCEAGYEDFDGSCEGIVDGLIAFYPLNGSGDDASGNGQHATVFDATATQDRFGRADRAMFFDDIGERVVAATSGHPTGEVTITYTAWVRPASGFEGFHGVLAVGDVLEANKRSSIVVNPIEYAGESNDITSPARVPDEAWSFIAVTKAGRSVSIYRNGRLVHQGTSGPGQNITNTQIAIGLSRFFEEGNVYEQFYGAVDDVRIYGRALTAEEISLLYGIGGWVDPGAPENPAASCQQILELGLADSDGNYWLDVDGAGASEPFEAWCDMSTAGGGWTLVYAYTFTNYGAFTDNDNAITPRPSWPAAQAQVPISTTPPTAPDDYNALDWELWSALGDDILVQSNINDWIHCSSRGGRIGPNPDDPDGPRGGPVLCANILDVAPTCNWVPFSFYDNPDGYGPMLAAEDLYYYWDGRLDNNWPTHDPCGRNEHHHVHGEAAPHGAVFLREFRGDPEGAVPGRTCQDIQRNGNNQGDGVYPIDPDGAGPGPVRDAYCDMSTEDGGWTLAWAYEFNNYEDFTNGTNAVLPLPTWESPDSDLVMSADPPLSYDDYNAWPFETWSQIGDNVLVRSDINDWYACSPLDGDLTTQTSGAVSCENVQEVAPACDGLAPTRFQADVGFGPALSGPDSYHYYWDGSTADSWPTHDPCGTNAANHLTGVAEPSGAILIRETGVPPMEADGRDCLDILESGDDRGDGLYWIDPEQDGWDFIEVFCVMEAAGGGWTQLTDRHFRYQRYDWRTREFLYYREGDWYRSPAAQIAWQWSGFQSIDGAWPYGTGATIAGAYECMNQESAAGGIGCSTGSGPVAKVLPAPDNQLDWYHGVTAVCQDTLFGDGICANDVRIFERRVECEPDPGSMLADGDFDHGTACWFTNGRGPFNGFVSDYANTAEAGMQPSLRATNDVLGNNAWDTQMIQNVAEVTGGHTYRLSFRARAQSARTITAFLQECCEPTRHFFSTNFNIGTSWGEYSIDFVVSAVDHPGTYTDAYFEFQFGNVSTAPVWIDGLRLEDLGD